GESTNGSSTPPRAVGNRGDAQSRQVLLPSTTFGGGNPQVRRTRRAVSAAGAQVQASASDPVTTEAFGPRWRLAHMSNPQAPQHADPSPLVRQGGDIVCAAGNGGSTRDVGSSHPGAGAGPKGRAVRPLKRYASWVQNVVRQFGPYPPWALEA